MDSLLSMLFFLLFTLFFSFNLAQPPSYKDHCASIVPESIPSNNLIPNSFPLGDHTTGYYFTRGNKIIGFDASDNSWKRLSFDIQPWGMHATQHSALFKIQATLSFRGAGTFFYHTNYSNGDGFSYSGQRQRRRYRRNYVTFKLEGFWSEPSGKLCMVGTGTGYSKTGESLTLDAVFKLNHVSSESNVSSLINGRLESLSDEKGEGNFFEPFSVFMFPKGNYSYTLDSLEAENECSSGSDGEKGLPIGGGDDSLSFCSYPLSKGIRRLMLEYSSDCSSSKNCSPVNWGSGNSPSLMALRGVECSVTEKKKHRLRALLRFVNNSYNDFGQGLNPTTTLIGEGWWDEKKNRLCVVACHVLGVESSSPHVGDCSVRLRLRFPSIWSINSTSKIAGQIWSSKSATDPEYFKRIAFRNYEDGWLGVQGMKYEYSMVGRVEKSCPAHKAVKNNKGRRYPDAYSNDMRFDISAIDSNRWVAWGFASPLSVNDHVYDSDQTIVSDAMVHNGNLFNISYKIRFMNNSSIVDRISLFNLSSQNVKISAEGIYDARTGTLCMVGCRDLVPDTGIQMANSVDCGVLLKFQHASLDGKSGSYIKGSIESTRDKSDPLYFRSLDLSSAAFYTEAAKKAVWRMDMEVTMVLISTTLACVFVALQLYHVKRNPNVLPFISLIMMSILTLGYMTPLVLNLEALLSQNPNNKNFVFGNIGWLEVNEISIRLITMVAFLLQFRLLQLTWSSRNTDESNKGLWIAERKAAYVTLPLYAAGLLIALMLKLKNDGDNNNVPIVVTTIYKQQRHSSWENFKSYGGLVFDGFLLPQIILNIFSNMNENVLSYAFYFGTTFVRLLPHAYDLYRTHSYAQQENGSYLYADPSADFYSTAWDIVIPLGGILFAVIVYLQQRFGGRYILPCQFQGSKVYEKVPAVIEPETELERTNM